MDSAYKSAVEAIARVNAEDTVQVVRRRNDAAADSPVSSTNADDTTTADATTTAAAETATADGPSAAESSDGITGTWSARAWSPADDGWWTQPRWDGHEVRPPGGSGRDDRDEAWDSRPPAAEDAAICGS